ncbi:hypothetical protein RS130_08285 [Paraglaciecola aquimarina]|uniref:Lipoprotein n=1 Tax=Paraglaciecola aquimarina TaxID=1235557 RepID=A0ABU3SV83_9ALTE|nr:hypothetical protein [Paraglaciecola aquimarina]MDU0353926.1 hypothetical protein [Paraglaciecola aquimarina]
MNVKRKINLLFSMSFLAMLSACTEEALSNNDAEMSYINALDEQATFYIKKSSNDRDIYDSDYRTISLLSGEASYDIEHDWFSYEKSYIGVEDTNTRSEQVYISTNLRDKRSYWVVAWLDNRDYDISVFQKRKSNMADVIRVRIFANDRYAVFIDGSNASSFITDKGEVSDYFSVHNCSELSVENNNINLCSADFGLSYLAVVDEHGLVSLIEEP